MRFFSLFDFQHWVLALFLGLTVLILVYLGFGGYARRRPEGPHRTDEHPSGKEPGETHEHGGNPVPPLLMVVYSGITVAVVIYLIVIGIKGGAF